MATLDFTTRGGAGLDKFSQPIPDRSEKTSDITGAETAGAEAAAVGADAAGGAVKEGATTPFGAGYEFGGTP